MITGTVTSNNTIINGAVTSDGLVVNGTINATPVQIEGTIGIVSGLSAYDIAVNGGFSGNEQEWLDSLNADKTATHNFTNQSTIVFQHNLNKYPAVTVVDSAGDECTGNVTHDSTIQITINFSNSFTGTIFCN